MIDPPTLMLFLAGADGHLQDAPASTGPDWWGALAGLHPLVIHFPIALIIVAALVELVALLARHHRLTSFGIIAVLVGTPFAVLAAWSGWSLADEGYGRGLELDLHRWLGVASVGLLALMFVLTLVSWFGHRQWATGSVRGLLLVSAILIGITAHFGGDMVWGKSLVAESLFPGPDATSDVRTAAGEGTGAVRDDPAPAATPAEPAGTAGPTVAAVSFEAQVKPILDTHCWDCHGPTGRAKAGIRLASAADFSRDIHGAPMVDPGSPEGSELFKVVNLPRDDDLAMPPSGPGLTKQEIEVLRRWILEGGRLEPAAAAPSTADVTRDEPRPQDPPAPPGADPLTDAQRSAMRDSTSRLRERGVSIRPVSVDNPFQVLNANGLSHRLEPPFGDADLALVAGLRPVLQDLDLANTEVTDRGISDLAGFDHLERISLKDTATSDPGARVLAGLPALEVVNLFGTQLGDEGLLELARSASIRRIYAGQTLVTESGVEAARRLRADVTIIWAAPVLPATTASAASPGL